MPKGYMYILECADGSYYTGSTKDLEKRLEQHQNGEGANHTRKRLPVKLVYVEEFGRIDEAFYREKQVQGWSRKKKEALIDGMPEKLHELARCLNETTHVGFDPAQPNEQRERSLSGAKTKDSALPTEQSERSLSGAETKGNIPQLRFPEFTDDWEIKLLGNLMSFKNGVNASKENYGSGYKFVNVLDIIENDFISHDLIKGEVTIPKNEFEKNKIEFGDIIFQRSSETRAEVGQSNVYIDKNKPATFGGFVIRGKRIGDFYPIYMHYLLKTDSARKEITSKSGGSTRYNIGQDTLSQVSIICSNNTTEQQKIADFLTAVDKRIRLLKEKKAALELYKKGAMQKIFPSNTSSNVPEIRFKVENKDGALVEPPDWVEKKLGEVCEKAKSGGTPKSTVKEYYDGDIPFLAISDMTSQGKFLTCTSKSISQKGIDNSSSWIVPENSIIYSMYASVGFVSINKIKLATSQAVMNILLKHNYNLHFVYYSLLNLKSSIHKYTETGTQGNINAQIVKSLKIAIPSFQEQTKIADFLSSIDQKIEKVAKALEATEQYKKGVLQQLFV